MNAPPNITEFGLVHHRAMNSPDGISAALNMADTIGKYTHIFEGDLCWDVTTPDPIFYFHHPSCLIDKPSREDILKLRETNDVVFLQDLASIPEPTRFIIELKTGRGDAEKAMRLLVEYAESHFQGRYWIDAFSINLLSTIKSICKTVTTSLHTKFIYSSRLLRSSLDLIPFAIPRIERIDVADIITATYSWNMRTEYRRKLGIDKVFSEVAAAGKSLALGGLLSHESFQSAEQSLAIAGYAKFPIDCMARQTPAVQAESSEQCANKI